MEINASLWQRILLSVLFFCVLKVVISYTVLSCFYVAVVDAEFSHQNAIEIFYTSGRGFQSNHSKLSKEFLAGKRQKEKILLNNNVARYLRINTSSSAGMVKLYSLRLGSFYGSSIVFDHNRLYEEFEPGEGVEVKLYDDHILIIPNNNNAYLTTKKKLVLDNIFLSSVFPVLVSLLFFFFISSFSLSEFPAIKDLGNKSSTTGEQVNALDGVRGMAALLVLLEHAGPIRGEMGAIGVWLFFGLSGFLLATPFVHDPAKAYSLSYMRSFLLRRVKRILPMYYVFIFATMFFRVKNPEIFRHLLFLQGDGHLWTIPQEMFFYLLLPLVMVTCCFPARKYIYLTVALLGAFIFLSNKYINVHMVALHGLGTMLPPKVGIFLSGVMFSFVYHWFSKDTFLVQLNHKRVKLTFSLLGIVLLLGLLLLSLKSVQSFTHIKLMHHSNLLGFLCALFILFVGLSDDALLGRILTFYPLRMVGLVGFSFYLLHPVLIGFCRSVTQYYFNFRLGGLKMFIIAGITTYLMSMLTYTYIERPFLQKK